ncbi:uncharacterized protein [Solanum tuberosum]|uniref:uncharacterized protein n=1 Tax=Solanum tuberosum TaxID=4113 RepID=UPI00073A2951|nr:PREDICTED: uncharacterized protein LOC107058673 [Solanum tuberosum]KAH0662438.1 hypothetical protein KY284_027369 [Solanum tuberosum]
MEPFEDSQNLEEFRRNLGMKHAAVNTSGKIWVFIDEFIDYEIVRDEEQMLTLKFHNQELDSDVITSMVYVKCTQGERLQLWESIEDLADSIRLTWLGGGDFNVISSEEEQLGGRPVTEGEVRDFSHCINVCNLEDQGYKGGKYRWWNGRTNSECIFKRLDRVVCNDRMQITFPIIEVEHLVRSGSNHTPLLITFKTSKVNVVRPFKFLSLRLKEKSFKEVIIQNWKVDFEGNPFSLFHYKLKKVKKVLAQWSRETLGNIFQEITTLEEIIKVQEMQFEADPSEANRENLYKYQANLKRHLHMEEDFWKQITGMAWFKDGERNTKLFHTYVKGRRKRLRVNRIQNDEGE